MEKFNPQYFLEVETKSGEKVEVRLPFTVEFDIQQAAYSKSQNSVFRVFNLGETTQNKLRRDEYDYDFEDIRLVTMKAGYGNTMSTIFKGQIQRGWTVREGSSGMVTTIEASNAAYAFMDSNTEMQVPSGTPNKVVIDNLVGSLSKYGISKGSIGDYPGACRRGNSYSGSTTNIINTLTGGGFFVSNMTANCLKDNECTADEILVIGNDAGLLGTPIRENTNIMIEVLFEPRVVVGQLVKLESLTGKNYNGYHKVISVHHKGTISESVNGSLVTMIGLYDAETFTRVMR